MVKWLRDSGFPELAIRVRAAVRQKNLCAHLVVTFRKDLDEYLRRGVDPLSVHDPWQKEEGLDSRVLPVEPHIEERAMQTEAQEAGVVVVDAKSRQNEFTEEMQRLEALVEARFEEFGV